MQNSASADVVTIAHLTDPHLFADPHATLLGINTQSQLQGVLQHMQQHRRPADLLLATGDLTQDGSPQGYARFLELAASLQLPVHALPGNHDQRENFYASMSSHAVPVIDLAHWRIVLLDSLIPGENGGHLEPSQLALLDELANQNDPRHVLVAMHHHPLPLGSAWLDTMVIDNAQELFDRIARYPQVRGLIWGHVHQSHDSTLTLAPDARELRMMATPATCFQFMPHSQEFTLDSLAAPGYRWLSLHANGDITTEVVRIPSLAIAPDLNSPGY